MVCHLEFQLDKTDAYFATVTDFDTGSTFSERKSEPMKNVANKSRDKLS